MTEPLYADCRLIVEPAPLAGVQNMARDEVLLEAAVQGAGPVVRVYQWERPTLSLGYFQEREPWMDAPPWSETAMVRRLTGGGAILHDQEWTYSCVLPGRDFRLRHPYDLYDRIHEAIVAFAGSYGVALRPRGENVSKVHEPYLCYLRGDSHDLCLGDAKIVGSAQRRRKAALLQHGSFLLRHSPLAPEIRGVFDLLPEHRLPDGVQSFGEAIAATIGSQIQPSAWSDAERTRAEVLSEQKYRRLDWD
ncbi:MAG TPA: hypothetical protein VFG20_14355 [Planctomycetaceae bacterium]|nr:hypothetical protein [Planctomycetaceae bacterium]